MEEEGGYKKEINYIKQEKDVGNGCQRLVDR